MWMVLGCSIILTYALYSFWLDVLSPYVNFFGYIIPAAAGAGLTGTKMARRTGRIEEFDFKDVGNNHGQGVSILYDL